jgi:hypothetical protein
MAVTGVRDARPEASLRPGARGLRAYPQLTGAVIADQPGCTFGTLQAVQAAGDLQALGGSGRPIVRLHVTDRATGLAQLFEAVR